MKKWAFIVFLGLASVSVSSAQYADSSRYSYVRPPSLKNLDNLNNSISLGLGVGGYYPYMGLYYAESPNVSLIYERTLLKHVGPGNVSLGALGSFKEIYSTYSGYGTGYNYRQDWNYYILGGRLTYHLVNSPIKNLEPYVGAMEGYYITKFKFTSTDPDYNEPADPGYYLTPNNYPNFFAFGIFAGIQSRFSNHGSIWGEIGYGYTTFAFGVNYKL